MCFFRCFRFLFEVKKNRSSNCFDWIINFFWSAKSFEVQFFLIESFWHKRSAVGGCFSVGQTCLIDKCLHQRHLSDKEVMFATRQQVFTPTGYYLFIIWSCGSKHRASHTSHTISHCLLSETPINTREHTDSVILLLCTGVSLVWFEMCWGTERRIRKSIFKSAGYNDAFIIFFLFRVGAARCFKSGGYKIDPGKKWWGHAYISMGTCPTRPVVNDAYDFIL